MQPTKIETIVQHTPGPWRVRTDRFSGLPEYPYSVGATTTNGHPVVIVPQVFGPTDDMREANARLIAAAPDLLQALSILLHDCETEDWDEPDDDLNAARAAIAKAEGRES